MLIRLWITASQDASSSSGPTIFSGLALWLVISALLIAILGVLVWLKQGLWAVWLAALTVGFSVLTIGLWSLKDMTANTKNIKGDLPIALGLIGFVIVVLWISQGVLATQVNIRLTARAFAETDSEKALLIVALSVENTGVRQTEIKVASLVVCPVGPGECPVWDALFCPSRPKSVGFRDKNELGFGAPYHNEFPDNDPKQDAHYYITWGTQETRQVAFELPVAKYYDVRFSLGTGEMGVRSVNKWRATCIVPLEKEWSAKEVWISRLAGKSIEQERGASATGPTLGLLKKFLGGGGGKE
jgi:hypothetical protein